MVSFELFCKEQYNSEALEFWKEANIWQSLPEEEMTSERIKMIYDRFLLKDSPQLINLPGPMTVDLKRFYERINRLTIEEKRNMFVEAQEEMVSLMLSVFNQFVVETLRKKHLLYAEEFAKWWKYKMSLKEFFTFPQMINSADARLHSLCCGSLIIIIILLTALVKEPVWVPEFLAVYLSYGYLTRTLCGPRLDPQAFVVLFLLRPLMEDKLRLIKSEFRNQGIPRRIAQFLGAFCAGGGTILIIIANHLPKDQISTITALKNTGMALLAFLLLMAVLVLFLDFCLACYCYKRLRRIFFPRASSVHNASNEAVAIATL